MDGCLPPECSVPGTPPFRRDTAALARRRQGGSRPRDQLSLPGHESKPGGGRWWSAASSRRESHLRAPPRPPSLASLATCRDAFGPRHGWRRLLQPPLCPSATRGEIRREGTEPRRAPFSLCSLSHSARATPAASAVRALRTGDPAKAPAPFPASFFPTHDWRCRQPGGRRSV